MSLTATNTTSPTATTTTMRALHANTLSQERDPFQIRYDIDSKLPRELREEARSMDWGLFKATYAPAPTMYLNLTTIEQVNWCERRYVIELTCTSKTAIPTTTHCEVTATGPAAAISQILNDNGRYVEILSFHQIELYEATVTCVKVAHQVDHTRCAWAVGFGASPAHSITAALASGAQRIYGNL